MPPYCCTAPGPGVVGGERVFGVAAELGHHLAQVARAAFDRFGRIERVGDTQRGSGTGHQLRQALRSGAAAGARVEVGLLLDQAVQHRGVEAVARGRLFDQRVVLAAGFAAHGGALDGRLVAGADDAGGARGVRGAGRLQRGGEVGARARGTGGLARCSCSPGRRRRPCRPFRSEPAAAAPAAPPQARRRRCPRGRRRAPARSCAAPAEARDGDLVERVALAARLLAVVLAAVALPEAVEHLVLAGGRRELGVARRDLRLALLKLAGAQPALRLDALEERLAREQVGGADGLAAVATVRCSARACSRCASAVRSSSTVLERRTSASASSRCASFSLRSRTARTRSRRKRNEVPVTAWLSDGRAVLEHARTAQMLSPRAGIAGAAEVSPDAGGARRTRG